MEKIIATTDLSTNSRAGVRFAMQLAQARQSELVIVHVHYVLRASMWNDKDYEHYVGKASHNLLAELTDMVKDISRDLEPKFTAYKLALYHHSEPVEGILEFAEQEAGDYICISTHGAGVFDRIIGTNTSRLMSRSRLPILSVPHNYRLKPLKEILYASDMEHYEQELRKVVAFARPMNLAIDMTHLAYEYETAPDKTLLEARLEETMGYSVNFLYRKRDTDASVLEDINKVIDETRPSMLAMFTNQERDLFSRIFSSSNAAAYSFQSKLPVLSFNKE